MVDSVPRPDWTALGEDLRRRREERGLSLENLSYAAHSTKKTVTRIEAGLGATVPAQVLLRVALALDHPLARAVEWAT